MPLCLVHLRVDPAFNIIIPRPGLMVTVIMQDKGSPLRHHTITSNNNLCRTGKIPANSLSIGDAQIPPITWISYLRLLRELQIWALITLVLGGIR